MDTTTTTQQRQPDGAAPPSGASASAGPRAAIFEARPRLRHDVLFADAGDGVLLRSADGGFLVRGRSAYRLTSMLVPYLTGENTVAELCAGLPDAQRSMVTNFVRTLLDRGYARDARPSAPVDLPPAVLDRFGSQINYIDHYVDDAATRFARFRASRVLIAGTGPIAHAAAASLIRNGIAAVTVLATADPEGRLADLVADAETLTLGGCPAEVRLLDAPLDTLGAAELAGYDVVLAPAEGLGVAHLLRYSASRAAVVLPAAVVGGSAVLGPLVRPDATPCWICAALRLGANLEPGPVLDLWRDAGLPQLAGSVAAPSRPVAAMLGNMLGYEVFRLRSGCLAAETEGAVVVQDLSTLDVVREPLLAHPLCPSCAVSSPGALPPVAAAIPEPRPVTPESGDETAEEFARLHRHQTLMGTHVGVLTAFDDSGVDQSPLKVGRVRLGPPDRYGAGPRTVVAFDLHNVLRARSRAVHEAALAYVGRAVSLAGARVVSSSRLRADGLDPLPHNAFTTWSGLPADDERVEPWLPAVSLLTQDVRQVPAAAVYPFASVNRHRVFEASRAGSGAGPAFDEAVGAGLLSALAYAAVRDAVTGRRNASPMLVDSAELGSELDFLLRTARNLNLPFELLRLAGYPAPVVLATAPGDEGAPPAYAVAAALSVRQSTVEALRDLVGGVQLRQQFGPDAPVDLGDPLLDGLDVRAFGRAGIAAGHGDHGTVDAVLERLRADGRDAFVVPTTTPDLTAGGVVTVRVLLTTAAG